MMMAFHRAAGKYGRFFCQASTVSVRFSVPVISSAAVPATFLTAMHGTYRNGPVTYGLGTV